jgi:hypothetical protein
MQWDAQGGGRACDARAIAEIAVIADIAGIGTPDSARRRGDAEKSRVEGLTPGIDRLSPYFSGMDWGRHYNLP